MNGWILVGEKSASLKDVDLFIHELGKSSIYLEKVFVQDVSVCTGNTTGIYVSGKKQPLPDLSISAFFGDYNCHNHYVVQALESMGVLCINPFSCLVNARDKLKSFLLAKAFVPSIKLPRTLLFQEDITEDLLQHLIGFPLIAKINHGAKGDGVYLVENYNELTSTIAEIKQFYKDQILLQEFIASSKGKDLRMILCGQEIITSFIRSNDKSFKSNLNSGGTLEFFSAPKHLEQTALEIASVLNMKLGSIDFLLGENETFYFCEANSMPGLSYINASKERNLENPFNKIAKNIYHQVLEHKK